MKGELQECMKITEKMILTTIVLDLIPVTLDEAIIFKTIII